MAFARWCARAPSSMVLKNSLARDFMTRATRGRPGAWAVEQAPRSAREAARSRAVKRVSVRIRPRTLARGRLSRPRWAARIAPHSLTEEPPLGPAARNPSGSLRGRGPARGRRHGRGVSRPGREARPGRGPQGVAAASSRATPSVADDSSRKRRPPPPSTIRTSFLSTTSAPTTASPGWPWSWWRGGRCGRCWPRGRSPPASSSTSACRWPTASPGPTRRGSSTAT